MDWQEKVLAAGAIAIALAAIGVVLRFVGRTLWRMLRGAIRMIGNTKRVLDELTREQVGQPDAFEAFRVLITDVGQIKTQVTANGGTSDTLADRVQRIELAFGRHVALPAVEAHAGRQGT